jgi:predicted RNA-binding Zn ribbon-like protein
MTLPGWVPADETKPAPPPLLQVQAFLNTWEADRGSDILVDPGQARAWLSDAGLWHGDDEPTSSDLQFAREVREAVRSLLRANGGGPVPTEGELRPLTELASGDGPRFVVSPTDGRVELEPGSAKGVRGGLSALLLVIRDSQRDGTWQRLKSCDNSECGWAFYDRSHSRQGRWCDMAVCGNRIKNRSLRARRR